MWELHYDHKKLILITTDTQLNHLWRFLCISQQQWAQYFSIRKTCGGQRDLSDHLGINYMNMFVFSHSFSAALLWALKRTLPDIPKFQTHWYRKLVSVWRKHMRLMKQPIYPSKNRRAPFLRGTQAKAFAPHMHHWAWAALDPAACLPVVYPSLHAWSAFDRSWPSLTPNTPRSACGIENVSVWPPFFSRF